VALIKPEEMARLPTHEMHPSDAKAQVEKLSAEHAQRRGAHLEKLRPVFDLVRARAPLPISYDVMRIQPPHFFEFSETEMLGQVWVTPQSSEVAARMLEAAAADPRRWPFRIEDHLPVRDKYQLEAPVSRPRKIVFLPGGNIFEDGVSPELLRRLMHEDAEVVIKPHPITGIDVVRFLGRAFGYHRVFRPELGSAALIPNLDTAHVTASTEMGFYALLAGARIRNITRYPFEPRATFTPFYRLLWARAPDAARKLLLKVLGSPLSGFFHVDDPDLEEKVEVFYAAAMRMRAFFRPRVEEFTPDRWGDLILPPRQPQPKGAPNAVGQDQGKEDRRVAAERSGGAQGGVGDHDAAGGDRGAGGDAADRGAGRVPLPAGGDSGNAQAHEIAPQDRARPAEVE
jgi:hypothetical protein